MKKHHLLLFFLFLFISCSTHKKYGACELKETDETLSFPIDSDTKNNFNIYSVYKDKDRKSTRLNSSHITSSYAVFCLKK